MASSTARGFCDDDAESRYTRRFPLISVSKIGKSFLRVATSSASTAISPPLLRPPCVVSLLLQLPRQLGAAAVDHAPVDEDVHPVGLELVEDALVVGDQQHAEIGPCRAHLLHAPCHHPQRIDV